MSQSDRRAHPSRFARIGIAALAALLVLAGEYLFVRGLSLLRPGPLGFLFVGVLVTTAGCATYVRYVGIQSWPRALLVAFVALLLVVPLAYVVVLPIIDTTITVTPGLRPLARSGSFANGILLLFLVIVLSGLAHVDTPRRWGRLLLSALLGFLVLVLLEYLMAPAHRPAGNGLRLDGLLSVLYGLLVWILTTVIVSISPPPGSTT